jgi:hypothetical protein
VKKGAVAVAYVRIAMSDYEKIKKQMDGLKNAPAKVMKNLTSDAKKRVPGWVATEVTKTYGIKKTDITQKKVGDIKAVGSGIKDLKFVYSGRLLTPTHFSMSPKAPKPGGGYTLKASILKGQKKTLGNVKKLTKKHRASLQRGMRNSPQSPWMLQHTGAESADGVQYIPFQRREQPGKMKYVMKTISLPQMVSSERTAGNIKQAINEGLSKRLEHHLNRQMPK